MNIHLSSLVVILSCLVAVDGHQDGSVDKETVDERSGKWLSTTAISETANEVELKNKSSETNYLANDFAKIPTVSSNYDGYAEWTNKTSTVIIDDGQSTQKSFEEGDLFAYLNATCNEGEDPNCIIDHNITCVGDPIHCNLTYDEYLDMLLDYIYPSVPEWILISSHAVVFVMGLVRNEVLRGAIPVNKKFLILRLAMPLSALQSTLITACGP